MASANTVDEGLWNRFHELVNMSSRELRDWLRTRTAQPDAEPFPDQAGTATGQHVLHILSKRRTDLTDEDARVMQRVVRRIEQERGEQPEPRPGDAGWRRRLMSLGHDPLKPD
jgi:uncharacterized protein DUF3140